MSKERIYTLYYMYNSKWISKLCRIYITWIKRIYCFWVGAYFKNIVRLQIHIFLFQLKSWQCKSKLESRYSICLFQFHFVYYWLDVNIQKDVSLVVTYLPQSPWDIYLFKLSHIWLKTSFATSIEKKNWHNFQVVYKCR